MTESATAKVLCSQVGAPWTELLELAKEATPILIETGQLLAAGDLQGAIKRGADLVPILQRAIDLFGGDKHMAAVALVEAAKPQMPQMPQGVNWAELVRLVLMIVQLFM